MDSFAITESELRGEIYLVELPDPVESSPLGGGQDMYDLSHQDSVIFSDRQDGDIVGESN